MGDKCDKCGKEEKIMGLVNSVYTCAEENCQKKLCEECIKKEWDTCADCGETYCKEHFKRHICERDEEDEDEGEQYIPIFCPHCGKKIREEEEEQHNERGLRI